MGWKTDDAWTLVRSSALRLVITGSLYQGTE